MFESGSQSHDLRLDLQNIRIARSRMALPGKKRSWTSLPDHRISGLKKNFCHSFCLGSSLAPQLLSVWETVTACFSLFLPDWKGKLIESLLLFSL